MTSLQIPQYFNRAKGFLDAARIVQDVRANNSFTRDPVLHLIAHSLELQFKYCLLATGVPPSSVREFGHDLTYLWNDCHVFRYRLLAYGSARHAWANASQNPSYENEFNEDSVTVLDDNTDSLSHLHTSSSDFALRYPGGPDERGPVPLLLLDTFEPIMADLQQLYPVRDQAASS